MSFPAAPARSASEQSPPGAGMAMALSKPQVKQALFLNIHPEAMARLEAFSWPGNSATRKRLQHAVLGSSGPSCWSSTCRAGDPGAAVPFNGSVTPNESLHYSAT